MQHNTCELINFSQPYSHQCFGSGFKWVSRFGISQVKIAPKKGKKKLFVGLKASPGACMSFVGVLEEKCFSVRKKRWFGSELSNSLDPDPV